MAVLGLLSLLTALFGLSFPDMIASWRWQKMLSRASERLAVRIKWIVIRNKVEGAAIAGKRGSTSSSPQLSSTTTISQKQSNTYKLPLQDQNRNMVAQYTVFGRQVGSHVVRLTLIAYS